MTDNLRLIFTYGIALVVLIGGGLLLVIPSQIDKDNLLPFMTGIFATVLNYVFFRETSAGQARATERAVAAGAASQSSPPAANLPPPPGGTP